MRAARPTRPNSVAHPRRDRSERGLVLGQVVVLGDLAHVVRRWAGHEALERESAHAVHDDVRSAVGQRVRVVDLGDAANAAGLEIGVAHPFRTKDNAEARISVHAIRQHLPIPRLENVQRQRCAGEQNQREREERQKVDGHSGKVQHRSPPGTITRACHTVYSSTGIADETTNRSASRSMRYAERRAHLDDLAVYRDAAESPAKLDATLVHDVAVGEPSRLIASLPRNAATRPAATSRAHVPPRTTITCRPRRPFSARPPIEGSCSSRSPTPTKTRALRYRADLTVELQLDGERADSPEESQRGDQRGESVAEVALEPLAGSHEHDVRTDGARIQKDAPVDGRDVGCGRLAVRGQLGGLRVVGRDAVVLGEVIERSAGYDGERGFFSDERRGGFRDRPVTASDDDSLGALTSLPLDLAIELLRRRTGRRRRRRRLRGPRARPRRIPTRD